MTANVDRRRFLAAAGGTAAVAAAAGVGGELLLRKGSQPRLVTRPAPTPTVPIVKPKPLPKNVTLDIPGLSPFYTPNTQFYRVDTSLVIPQIPPSACSLAKIVWSFGHQLTGASFLYASPRRCISKNSHCVQR